MIIPVHMFAFANDGDRGVVRMVNIPDAEFEKAEAESVMNALDLIFKYGQNDFQNIPYMPSISAGDVIGMYKGAYWMVMGVGWKALTKEEFDALKPPTSLYAMEMGIKDAVKETE